MVRLYVNIDHVATLRQQRGDALPRSGRGGGAVRAGRRRRHHRPPARGPPPHPGPRRARPARDGARRAEPGDGRDRRRWCASRCEVKPDVCTLVPERREELTTEGGLDVSRRAGRWRRSCAALTDAGIGVSLFIDPEPARVEASAALGAAHRRAAHGRLLPGAAPRAPSWHASCSGWRCAARAAGASGLHLGGGARARLRERRPGGRAAGARGAEHRPRPGGARRDHRHARRRRRAACSDRGGGGACVTFPLAADRPPRCGPPMRRRSSGLGVPEPDLMENAGRGVAGSSAWVDAGDGARRDGDVAIVCGAGNNGGDGFVAARHLARRGVPVHVVLTAPPGAARGDAALNLTALAAHGRRGDRGRQRLDDGGALAKLVRRRGGRRRRDLRDRIPRRAGRVCPRRPSRR